MKNLIFVLGFLLIPSVSFSAQLTNDQANSLIAIVQSSKTTPASAFVSLITAFSSITILQAESLITVIQAAPGVPANAFVNMLLAFTVDIPIKTSDQILGGIAPVIPTSTPIVHTPVVESVVMKEIIVNAGQKRLDSGGNAFYDIYVYYDEKDAVINISASSGEFTANGKLVATEATSKVRGRIGTEGKLGVLFQYSPVTKGNRNITISVGDVIKIIEVEGN